MSQQIDIVVVAFTGELKLLQLQARSIRLYADFELIRTIHICVHDQFSEIFVWHFRQKILQEYGRFAPKVNLVDCRTLFGRKIRKPAWWSQQPAKLLAARLVQTENYLVLDCKNHLIRQLTFSKIYDEHGRMKMPLHGLHEPYRQTFIRACQYFGLKDAPNIESALPTITPFLFNTKIVRELLSEVESREDYSFYDFFMRERYTEFYFYLAFILASKIPLNRIYSDCSRIAVTFFDESLASQKIMTNNDDALKKGNVYSLGLHRRAIINGSADFKKQIMDYWLKFGLTANNEQAEYFLTPDRPVLSKKTTYIKTRILHLCGFKIHS